MTLRYGFMDEPHIHSALKPLLPRFDSNADSSKLTYVLGHERVVAGTAGRMGPIAERIFGVLNRNAANPSDVFDIPPSQVVEVGSRVDL